MRLSPPLYYLVLALLAAAVPAPAAPVRGWNFAVVSDPHGAGSVWRAALEEIRDGRANPPLPFSPAELIAVTGDMDPPSTHYGVFLKVFSFPASRPLFLPVIGNHGDENEPGELGYVRDAIIPALPGAVRRHGGSCDFYLDHRNARFIVVDAYTELGYKGVINSAGREWVERAIVSAPPSVEHIFIFSHEPAFPRYRHLGSSFNADPRARDAFWRMLVRHRDRVRAFFAGHIHRYYRMRVRDPGGRAANDTSSFPDEEGGVWQVEDGAVGPGMTRTIVQVQVDGERVNARALQSGFWSPGSFSVKDQWTMDVTPAQGALRPARSIGTNRFPSPSEGGGQPARHRSRSGEAGGGVGKTTVESSRSKVKRAEKSHAQE